MKKFYYSPLPTKCQTCGKPAGFVIKSGGETYNYACNEVHAKQQAAKLEQYWNKTP